MKQTDDGLIDPLVGDPMLLEQSHQFRVREFYDGQDEMFRGHMRPSVLWSIISLPGPLGEGVPHFTSTRPRFLTRRATSPTPS